MKQILIEQIVHSIGGKIRTLRTQERLSLQQLADRAGVSSTAIHKIERGTMTPTITVLMKIADAFGRKVGYFVGEDGELDDFDFQDHVEFVPAANRKPIGDKPGRIKVEHLALKLRDGKIHAALYYFEPGTSSGDRPTSHLGEEFIFQIEGEMEGTIDGRTYNLRPGDSIHFFARLPHTWRVAGRSRALTLWVMTPPPFGSTEIWSNLTRGG
ncbi:MAG: XRE family transcriptional regulator [Proteobacteria bacterium]|nr:XRE family transcriptional regulator [Pseudomonadota bacterium]